MRSMFVITTLPRIVWRNFSWTFLYSLESFSRLTKCSVSSFPLTSRGWGSHSSGRGSTSLKQKYNSLIATDKLHYIPLFQMTFCLPQNHFSNALFSICPGTHGHLDKIEQDIWSGNCARRLQPIILILKMISHWP